MMTKAMQTTLGWALLAMGMLAVGSHLLAAAPQDEPTTFASLLDEMLDRERLAAFPEPAYSCVQASSYDRRAVSPETEDWFANSDRTNFIRQETIAGRSEHVMMDAAGPGALVRYWMAESDDEKLLGGTIRIYLDGSDEPVIEEIARDLLSGTGPIDPPLSAIRGRGRNLYLPIPYAEGCKVTWEGSIRQAVYYCINYRKYASGTPVESFRSGDLQRHAEQLATVQDILINADKVRPAHGDTIAAKDITLAPGAAIKRTLSGPGAIGRLEIQLAADDLPQALRSTVLRIAFDGQETVWCPLGDFFGSGIGVNPYEGWYRSVSEDGLMACRWVMPYKNECTVQLENLGSQPVELVQGRIDTTDWTWDDRSMYFHTGWRQQRDLWTKRAHGYDWNYITIEGQGVVVGDTLAMCNALNQDYSSWDPTVTPRYKFNGKDHTWWGEGDEKIYLDGETFPSTFGTGTEDYYGYAYGGRGNNRFEAPFHAQPLCFGNNRPGNVTNTRSRALDAMPFNSSLRLDMEIWHWSEVPVVYAATTYWYGRPGAKSNRTPEPKEAAASVQFLEFPTE